MKWLRIVLVLLLLTGCFSQREADTKLGMDTSHFSNNSSERSDDNSEANAPREKLSDWILFRGENDNGTILYLRNAMDEESFVNVDGFSHFFMKDSDGVPSGGVTYVSEFSKDGKKVSLINESHQRPDITLKIYDLMLHQVEFKFELPKSLFSQSSDLNQYLFEENEDIYLFRAKENLKTKLALGKDIDFHKIVNTALFSPDGSKLCFEDNDANLIVFDILNNRIIKKINTGAQKIYIAQWFAEDKLIYKDDNATTYLLTIESEERKMLGKSMSYPIISPDGQMLVYTDQERNVFQLNLQNQQKTKLEDAFQRIGFEVYPVQWIRSSTQFMDVKKSIPVKRVTASSTLPDENKISYNANQLTDGNTKTGWCEGIKGDGIGETVTLEFGELREVSGIDLINGLAQSLQTFKANNRVKSLKAEFSDGSSEILNASFVQMNFGKKVKTSFIKLTILEVEKGDKYSDTCMSEVRVF
ncbi:NADase-type glycan-binding domain-containing protein [Paenibacillus oleatilyticus]|uniref:Discoidin domain-containing protein n=1 Tax=Paenibacillus oleatilyticus TaxID=2594886 RepID=A0ABV4UW44_9BACL